jgi:nitrite reductase/ring-hydroxylating ferredoxin subunit
LGNEADSRIRVAALSDLGDARPTMLFAEAGSREILIIAADDDSLHAIDAVCTHGFGYLDQGELKGCEIQCPLHEGRFDIRTGEPTNPPAQEPLNSYPVTIDGDDVYIEIDSHP